MAYMHHAVQPVDLIERQPEDLALLVGGVGAGLVFVGLALLGARVLRASDAEWEDGRPA